MASSATGVLSRVLCNDLEVLAEIRGFWPFVPEGIIVGVGYQGYSKIRDQPENDIIPLLASRKGAR